MKSLWKLNGIKWKSEGTAASSQQPAASSQQSLDMGWGWSVLLREVRTLSREVERKSKGNPIGNLLELERNLKELHLEQQPAASGQQPAAITFQRELL